MIPLILLRVLYLEFNKIYKLNCEILEKFLYVFHKLIV